MTRHHPLPIESDSPEADSPTRRPKLPAHLILAVGVIALGVAWLVTRPGPARDADRHAALDSAAPEEAVSLGEPAGEFVPPPKAREDFAAKLKGSDLAERRWAASRLASDPEQARLVLPALRESLRDTDAVVSAHAAHALWSVDRDPQSITRLAVLLQSGEDDVRCLAAYILGSIGESAVAALPALRWEQRYNHGPLRLYAAEAIARIEPADRSAVETLLSGLRSNDPEQRALAAFALGNVAAGHTSHVAPMLRAALQDEDLRVRTAAEVALSALSAAMPSRT